ncbi:MAG: nucleotidyltransferase substrate binding protein [Candidatus Sericytochromatia bacterium]
MEADIRWKQRFTNFKRALSQLEEAVSLSQQRALSSLERQGLIKGYEFTYELAWNLMKDYFSYQGNVLITGSRDAIREAFQRGLIHDGESWMEMIGDRNKTAHIYHEAIALLIAEKICQRYFPLFQALQDMFQGFYDDPTAI